MHAPRNGGHQPRVMAPGALERGTRFLLANQGRDGLWRDFATPAGQASLWPTSFVATALHSAATGGHALDRAAQALVATQNDDGGWGYNEEVPTDADSTAWALLLLARVGCPETTCRRAVSSLARHQRVESGGLSTYSGPGPIRRFMGVGWWMPFWGWCRPHTEVTATAGRALTACTPGSCEPAIESAWRFVRSRQNLNGSWSSYWWTSPHYTTAQAVEFAATRGDHDVIDRAAAWTLRNRAEFAGSAFATALSLSILTRADAEVSVIDRAAADLVALQQADGGWPSQPIMRIPVPADSDPNSEGRWRVVRFGGGIEVSDQHRLFTSRGVRCRSGGMRVVEIPDDISEAIEQAVTNRLATELGARGLVLTENRFAQAETLAASDGKRLLTSVIHRCYPLSEYDTQVLTLEFESETEASRVQSALAFGAATARLLMSPLQPELQAGSIELLSAIFNLGIGLIDGVCDADADTGLRLLELIALGNVADVARQPRPRGWLRVQLPAELESDASVSFAADIVETFFATLHATYPGDSWLHRRGRVGAQLAAALEAERSSLVSSPANATREQLTHYSYATSVLPFEIVGTLTQPDHSPGAALYIGEAMWRIDDLVDLCDDARTGALNAILLAATTTDRGSLEWLLASDHIARAAAHAADGLLRGLELADCHGDADARDVFLHFIARYAGIVPRDPS